MSNRRGLGPHASRRGLLKAGLAIGTLALGQRAALGQSGGAVHMPELGVAKLPVVPAMDQSLVEPGVRRSVNGVLSTSLDIVKLTRAGCCPSTLRSLMEAR